MPTYEYLCEACGHGFEQFQPITAKPVRKCPKCEKQKVRRVITGGAGLIFKGSGFYQTDYRSKNYAEAAKKDSPAKKDKPEEKKSSNESSPCGPTQCKQPEVCSPATKKKK